MRRFLHLVTLAANWMAFPYAMPRPGQSPGSAALAAGLNSGRMPRFLAVAKAMDSTRVPKMTNFAQSDRWGKGLLKRMELQSASA